MTFRQKCVKHLVVLGIILVILQVLLSSHYDHLKTVYNNSTFSGVKKALGSLGENIRINNNTLISDTLSFGNQNLIKKTNETGKNIQSTPNHIGHEGHNGFELASAAHNVCTTQHIISPGAMKTIHAIPGKRLLYCPMEKIGTTFWRRVLYMLVANEPKKYKQPYDVPIYTALGQAKRFTHPISSSRSGNLLAQSSFSFLFVRNPYSRLLSAFIDKLVPPNPTFWKAFGVKAISQYRPKEGRQSTKIATGGHDVTFAEFLKYVVNTEKSGRGIDAHIISINKGCKPCVYNYKYVGRMESFKDDALFIMRKLEMNSTVEAMEKSFTDFTLDDAITDSIRSPFSWKAAILKYISWEKALQRIWLKLQMRGIIETRITLNIAKEDINKVDVNQFIEMARQAHRDSDPIELKKQKDLAKKEAFATVPLNDLKAFRDTFKPDFDLFGYDSSPAYIFDRGEAAQSPTRFFNYSHLN